MFLFKIEHILAVKRVVFTPQFIKKAEECCKMLGQKGGRKFNADIHALVAILHDEEALKHLGIVLEKQEHNRPQSVQ